VTEAAGPVIRHATLDEVPAIHAVLSAPAAAGQLLVRTLPELYETVRDFFVGIVDGRIAGCGALHVYGPRIAEIKALAVDPDRRRQGLGRRLVDACCDEAAGLGLERVFVLTYQREFFMTCGFRPVDRSRLPEKVWGECVRCSRFLACDETALWRQVGTTVPSTGVGP
jgi:amino-acid N-acetyltransferase